MPARTSVTLDTGLWDRFFLVSPLVVVGTREEDGSYDLAAKNHVMPVGWDGFFAFACTPRHRTYHNVRRERCFTVSYPTPDQIVLSSLSAAPRDDGAAKPSLAALPTVAASEVDGVVLDGARVQLECELGQIVDGLGRASLIIGKVLVAHVDPDALRVSDSDDADLLARAPLLTYLQPGRYATTERSATFPFHVGTEY